MEAVRFRFSGYRYEMHRTMLSHLEISLLMEGERGKTTGGGKEDEARVSSRGTSGFGISEMESYLRECTNFCTLQRDSGRMEFMANLQGGLDELKPSLFGMWKIDCYCKQD